MNDAKVEHARIGYLWGCICNPKKSSFNAGTFIFYTFINMQEKKCRGLVISKEWLEKHYPKEYGKLNELLGADWYIYQDYTIYYLVCGECETSFISLRMDLNELIDGIGFGILLAKHGK